MVEVSGAVLAGGRSTRMGAPKALAPFGGEPLVARALRALAAAEERLVACGPSPDPRLAAACGDARLVPDPGTGPLGALDAAARAARGTWLLVAPCDAPLLAPAVYARLLARAAGREGAAWTGEGGPDPLVAAYRRDALARAAAGALAEGRRAARDALARLDVALVDDADLAPLVVDADTPEALAALGDGRAGARRP